MEAALAKIERNTDLISSCGNLLFNTALLASKCLPQIPESVGRVARPLLGYMGIVRLNIDIKEIHKYCSDAKLAFQAKDTKSFFYCATKMACKALDIFLIIIGFAATLFALVNYGAAATAIYAALKCTSIPCILYPIAHDIAKYWKAKNLTEKLKGVEEESACRISSYVRSIIRNKPQLFSCTKEEKKLGRDIVQDLDLYTIEQMKRPRKESTKPKKTFSGTNFSEMRTQLTAAKIDLALRSYGYIGMGINRRFPDTLLQAGVNWQCSAYYTLRDFWQRWETAKINEKRGTS